MSNSTINEQLNKPIYLL